MTTKVIISSPQGNHLDVFVEVYNPSTGSPGFGTRRLTDGETSELWIHSGCALRVSEIPKLPKVEVPVQEIPAVPV